MPRVAEEQPPLGHFSSLVGDLLWVTQCTRPEIDFAVNRVSQFLQNPSEAHWQGTIQVLNYLVCMSHL